MRSISATIRSRPLPSIEAFAVLDKAVLMLNGKYVCARALDDRLGCYVVLRALERLREESFHWKVHFAFSVQEEVGSHAGAAAAVARVRPDAVVVVECTYASDARSTPAYPHA